MIVADVRQAGQRLAVGGLDCVVHAAEELRHVPAAVVDPMLPAAMRQAVPAEDGRIARGLGETLVFAVPIPVEAVQRLVRLPQVHLKTRDGGGADVLAVPGVRVGPVQAELLEKIVADDRGAALVPRRQLTREVSRRRRGPLVRQAEAMELIFCAAERLLKAAPAPPVGSDDIGVAVLLGHPVGQVVRHEDIRDQLQADRLAILDEVIVE